jgi:hypothetical protein
VRTIRFLPLVFLVGIDGFAMFAPYVLLLFLTGYLISRLRSQQRSAAELSLEAELLDQGL